MMYRIVYEKGKCENYAGSRADLLQWLELLKDEIIMDIWKVRNDGAERSVLSNYKKYIEKSKKNRR